MIEIYRHQEILEHFAQFPTTPLKVYCPGSGSWYETFDNKEHYLRRKDAHDKLTEWFNHSPDGIMDKAGNRLLNEVINNSGHRTYEWNN